MIIPQCHVKYSKYYISEIAGEMFEAWYQEWEYVGNAGEIYNNLLLGSMIQI